MEVVFLEKEIAIVTGGASGIGLAIAEELMAQNIQVIAADLNQEMLTKLTKENELFDGQTVNVTDEANVKEFIDYVTTKYGHIDRSFHVAGALKQGAITEQSLDDWNFTVNIILNGVFLFTKYVGQQMKKQNHGNIVNIASLNAHVPMFYGSAYSSAKAGVEMLTKSSALEFSDYHINVNTILPGVIATPINQEMLADETISQRYKERIPLKRPGRPDELAKPAVFLSSPDASYINGTSLVVDGGWEITGYPDLRK